MHEKMHMIARKYPKRPWVSAHTIIFNQDGEILLTKRAAPPKANYWFPPGGVIDLGETVIEGLSREILEETSITITNLNFLDYIDGLSYDNERKVLYHYVIFIFRANYLEGEVKANDDALDAKWFSVSDILSGNILIPSEIIRLIKKF
ncbi:MAG: NUDIX hydrolase [Candidatus Hodarchaeota archaeon]